MIWLVLLAIALPAVLVLLVLGAARPRSAAFVRRGRVILIVVGLILGVAQMAIGIIRLSHPVISPGAPSWLYYSSAVWSVLSPVLLFVLVWRTNSQKTVPSR
jgi:hypothetical protein